MTALARQPLQIERVFQMLVRIAYLNLADMERRLERTTNAVDRAALCASIRQVKAALDAAEAVS